MKKNIICAAIAGIIILGLPLHLVARQVQWTIKGKFNLYFQLPEFQYAMAKGNAYPLKGMQVRVSAAEKNIGIWNTWPDVTTGSDGSFKVSIEKDQSQRKFRVEFRFHSSELEVRHENSTEELFSKDAKWYTAYETDDFFEAGTIDLGTFIFKDGAHLDMDEFEPRRHAEIWIAAKAAIDYLQSLGTSYAYTKQIKIKYPHDDTRIFGDVTASYANPLNGVIYLYRNSSGEDHFDVHTIYHEMMHIWAYQHNYWAGGGETALMTAIVKQGNSHGFATNEVAFHEGFAEYAADQLCLALFPKSNKVTVSSSGSSSSTWEEGTHYHTSLLPYNRNQLKDGVGSPGNSGSSKITSTDKMQTHDAGWWSFLHILTTPGLVAKSFTRASDDKFDARYIYTSHGAHQTGSCTLEKNLSFKDILKVFNSNSSAGYGTNLRTDDMKLDKFLQRAKAILGLSTKDADAYLRLADPANSLQPYDAWCK